MLKFKLVCLTLSQVILSSIPFLTSTKNLKDSVILLLFEIKLQLKKNDHQFLYKSNTGTLCKQIRFLPHQSSPKK